MIVTINTDASYSPQHKIGAYAFWIVCNQGKIMRSGPLKEAKNSTDAETKCIANALYCLLNSDFTGITKLIINSDSKPSFDKIKKNSSDSVGKLCSEYITQIREKHVNKKLHGKCFHQFRHVKAHSGIGNARKWVNDWCDKKAKEALRNMYPKKDSQ